VSPIYIGLTTPRGKEQTKHGWSAGLASLKRRKFFLDAECGLFRHFSVFFGSKRMRSNQISLGAGQNSTIAARSLDCSRCNQRDPMVVIASLNFHGWCSQRYWQRSPGSPRQKRAPQVGLIPFTLDGLTRLSLFMGGKHG